ncbi:MAG TPA: BON domain-containing protein [Frateuria sp.]|uniref:BON domain-containing protein n=1 Tax=Frateuria sp. TaxID=2211372 RepID=UPI002D80DB94|nr:BON domain-containing protein [Frateuria sp.]HET6807148.1 BON domain-containing protein [Frateuria sp.]
MKVALPRPLAVGLLAALAASASAFAQQATPMQASPAAGQSVGGATGADADNTRLNRRDRDHATTTPADQPNNSPAVDLVAKVRQAIVHDDGLSINARNVKVMADNGVVTLRGPVASAAEKARVERDATGVRGVTRVDNQLDIANDAH